MTSTNLRPMTFKAAPQEIKNIQRACQDLSGKITSEKPAVSSVDTAEIGGKLYLASDPSGHEKLKLSVKYSKDGDNFASTNLAEGSRDEIVKYVKNTANQKKIAELLDEFKKIVAGMQEKG